MIVSGLYSYLNLGECSVSAQEMLTKHRSRPSLVNGSPECRTCVLIWARECPELHWRSSAGKVVRRCRQGIAGLINLQCFFRSYVLS